MAPQRPSSGQPHPKPKPNRFRPWQLLQKLIHKHTILLLTILFIAGVGGTLLSMARLSNNLMETQAIESSRLYANAMREARSLYGTEAVARLRNSEAVEITPDYATQTEGAIPVPATYLIELGHHLSDNTPGMSVRLFSDYPFPNRAEEGGPKNEFEEQALQELRKQPNEPFFQFTTVQGRPSLRYAEADVMKSSCVSCHNTHPDSPKTNWKVGDVRGVLEIITPLDSYISQTRSGLSGLTALLVTMAVLALSGIAVVIGRLRNLSTELEQQVSLRTSELRQTNQFLSVEKRRSEHLLLNILPSPIAARLRQGNKPIADGFASTTVLFADLVNFTQLSEQLAPRELVALLNEIFSRFDRLTEQYGLEKIKTIGDAYMVVGGLPKPSQDHARAIAEMALAMRTEMDLFNKQRGLNCKIRIGINTGPVVAGVIGTKKFIYDLWGDTVNVASRMESHGIIGEIQVTESTYACLRGQYDFEARGLIEVKGKGELPVFLLKGHKTLKRRLAAVEA